jgi:enamine deaminase RidA (YjgF/YER057c/UK114 family)
MSDQTETGQRVLQPSSWPRPRGYANGIVAAGETIFLAGQVGWDAQGRFPEGLANQVHQALANIVTLLAQAGAGPQHPADDGGWCNAASGSGDRDTQCVLRAREL